VFDRVDRFHGVYSTPGVSPFDHNEVAFCNGV